MTVSVLIEKRRGLLGIAGEDRVPFLQSLVTNDVARAAGGQAIYAALLTAQGRFLHDFFVVAQNDALLLDCERERRADLQRRLNMYKLRARATVEDRSEALAVLLLWGADVARALSLPPEAGASRAEDSGIFYVDPRSPALGVRAVLPAGGADSWISDRGFAVADETAYDRLRIALGAPDGSRDLPVERALLMENNFDALNGIDWNKGCYVGQEVTARMRYRGLVRKRLLPVEIDGPAPAFGAPIMLDGAEAGEMRGSADGLGLALLRDEALEKLAPGAALACAGAKLRPLPPAGG
jgi:hypothetical protein